ncbi:MAG: hypothetical protein Q9170_002867 [Blastenia crenularia]
MPAKRGGGVAKGKAGKKAQIEKMIETAKKTPSPDKPKPDVAKPGSTSKKASTTVNVTASQRPRKDSDNTTGKVKTMPVKCMSSKTASVRLPSQASVASKKMPILWTRHTLMAAMSPKAFKNPNHVVVRLPSKQPSKEPTTFLTLPSEIRNIIYEYAMPQRKYAICRISRQTKYEKRPKELTYFLPSHTNLHGPGLSAAQGERRRLFDLPRRLYIDQAIPPYHLSPGPASLLLISKIVSEETTPMFYGRNTFSFSAMQPLRKFLKTLRPGTQSILRSLELIHHTAGNPSEISNQHWKETYDHCWRDLCFQVRDQCTGLDSLAIDLTINDIPYMRGPTANWMKPLYAFMNLGHLKKLYIRLHQFMTEDTILEADAYEIRQELMGSNFYAPKIPLKQVFGEQPKPKVRPKVNCLRIIGSMHNQSTRQLMQGPVHLLPRRLPLLDDPRATVFWHPPSPTDDHPLYHLAGSPGEAKAIRSMQLQKKADRMAKAKGKARA